MDTIIKTVDRGSYSLELVREDFDGIMLFALRNNKDGRHTYHLKTNSEIKTYKTLGGAEKALDKFIGEVSRLN